MKKYDATFQDVTLQWVKQGSEMLIRMTFVFSTISISKFLPLLSSMKYSIMVDIHNNTSSSHDASIPRLFTDIVRSSSAQHSGVCAFQKILFSLLIPSNPFPLYLPPFYFLLLSLGVHFNVIERRRERQREGDTMGRGKEGWISKDVGWGEDWVGALGAKSKTLFSL